VEPFSESHVVVANGCVSLSTDARNESQRSRGSDGRVGRSGTRWSS